MDKLPQGTCFVTEDASHASCPSLLITCLWVACLPGEIQTLCWHQAAREAGKGSLGHLPPGEGPQGRSVPEAGMQGWGAARKQGEA